VWGFSDRAAIPAAEDCGIAFQLTNILRDLKEDMLRDRVYLPEEDLERFGYSVEDLRAGVCDSRLQRLMEYEIERAEQFYGRAAPLADYLSADGRRIFSALVTTYHSLLDEIRRAGPHVLHARVRLGRLRKMWIVAHTLFSNRLSLNAGSNE
jgi:phytoene synthase